MAPKTKNCRFGRKCKLEIKDFPMTDFLQEPTTLSGRLEQYFDVTSAEFFTKLRLSMYPNSELASALTFKKELYGAFWVPVSVAIALFTTSSFKDDPSEQLWHLLLTVFLYTMIATSVCYYASRNLVMSISMVSYTQTIYILLAFLGLVKNEFVCWIFALVSGLLGASTLVYTLKLAANISAPRSHLALLVVAVIHAVYVFCLKIFFVQ